MRSSKALQVLTLIGGPAVLATMLGYTYLSIATEQSGLWLGANWQQDKLRMLVCGLIGLAIALHTTVSLAFPILLGAVTPDAGRIAMGLVTTSPFAAGDLTSSPQRNVQTWAVLLLGAPTLVALMSLRLLDLGLNLSLQLSALTAAVGLLWLTHRLRTANWSTPSRAVLWLIASVAFCVLVAISVFFVGLQFGARAYLEASWVNSTGQAAWAIVVAAGCAWFFSPAERTVMKRRVFCVFALVLAGSFYSWNAYKIVDTTLAVAAGGGQQGVLHARSSATALDLAPAACADALCRQSVPIRVVGYVGDRLVFWFSRPLGDGTNMMQWDDVAASQVRIQRTPGEPASRTNWLLL